MASIDLNSENKLEPLPPSSPPKQICLDPPPGNGAHSGMV